MKLLDQYIGRAVLQSTVVVMLVLLSLFAFATFSGELDSIGHGNYGAIDALQYTLLLMPGLAFQLFPIVVLLGAIIGLGMLASQSELIVMRAAGVSIKRIVWAVMRVGILLLLFMVVVGEYVAPEAEQRAQKIKTDLLEVKVSFNTEQGLWARDGNNVIHIRDLISKEQVANVSIYEFDEHNRLNKMIHAKLASFIEGQWHLNEVSSSLVSMDGVKTTVVSEVQWRSLLVPDLISVVTVAPSALTGMGLYRYVQYLRDNGLDASQYTLALWKKIMLPVTTIVMIFLAVPFVFGPLRSVGVGQRIFVGTLFGIAYYLIDQTTGHVGVVYGLSPLMSVLVAPMVFLSVAIVMVRRIF